ncbi:Type IV fimbrial biogenesis protein FimT [Pseudoalteromonas sp. JB197]|nr:Type IV fimbrial biogenesis protein FimT [Pseudoalteromonas sp. JB197]
MKKIQYGFTLLELMVTVAIVGIIATIALWNSSDMLEDNRAENFLLELKRNISYARSQAASTDEIVVVCPASSANVASSQPTLTCQS